MNTHARAYSISLVIHAFLLTAILFAGMIIPRTGTIVLDFSIGTEQAADAVQPRRPLPAHRERPNSTIIPTAESKQAAPLVQDKREDIPQPHTSEKNTQQETSQAAAPNEPLSADAAKNRYVAAHFVSIRDHIMKNLSYPLMARKMGWAGKVTISFTVREDGGVEDIIVVQSSGFPVLDRTAVETVKKCIPLPRPQARTALVMPILYRLQN